MKYIDLHVHSNISDGTLPPSEVVKLASKSNLSAIALTDHDTIEGLPEAIQTAKSLENEGIFIRIVEGVEISAAYKGKDIHILGLLVDINNQNFKDALHKALQNRDMRNEKMAANLRSAGIDVTVDALQFDEPNAVITRAHFARYLVEHHYVKTRDEAFDRYLGSDTKYYVPREYMTPYDAISIIKEAGGIPVLAHPLLYKFSINEVENLVKYVKELGMVGIETIYSTNTGFDEGIIRRFANHYDLLMTGGSDYHGSNKPHISIGIGMGNLKIPESLLDALDEYKAKL